MLCANCRRPTPAHCVVHLLPCCPGRCPGQIARPIAAAPPGGVVIRVTREDDGTFAVRMDELRRCAARNKHGRSAVGKAF